MESDIERDIRDHIEMETRDNIERGMSPEEAQRAALVRFGNARRIAEDTRAVWRWAWSEQMKQDSLYAWRGLRRNPVFATAAILTMALGIGMTTAVFSVVSAVLIKPLPYPGANRLAWVALNNRRLHLEASTAPDFADWRERAKSFEGMTSYFDQDQTVQDSSQVTKNRFILITPEFWRMAGVHPALGRLFSDKDSGVMVLTWQMFQRRFAGNPAVIGRVVKRDGIDETIIGVLPKDFRFLLPVASAAGIAEEPEAFEPMIITPQLRSRRGGILLMFVVAKLKPGVSFGAARSEISGIQREIIQKNPDVRFYSAVEAVVTPLKERLVGQSRRPLFILMAAVAFVLLIACANFANLLLARATTRQREIATRLAIGAGRARLIRQFVMEGVMLALPGALAGLALAEVCDRLLIRMNPAAVPRLGETVTDWRVFAFAFVVSLFAGAIFGLAPLVSVARGSVYASLKDTGANLSAGAARLRLRRVLVAGEISAALVLLTGASLMLKSFARMYEYPSGFEPRKIGAMKVFLEGPAYDDRHRQVGLAYAQRVLEMVGRVPGVETVAVTSALGSGPVQVEGISFPPGLAPNVRERFASASYARVVGLSLLSGRWTTDHEPAPAVMVNESFARRVFAGGEALGQKVYVGRPSQLAEIVGVVSDLKMMRLDADAEPEVLIPYKETTTFRRVDILFKTPRTASTLIPEVSRVVLRLDPAEPTYDAETLEAALDKSIAPRRFDLVLLEVFAGAAMLLAMIGVYGVMSYSVAQRTKEIGVRIAMGARDGDIVRMMLRQAIGVAAVGIVAGTAASLGLTRLMTTLLFEVKPRDPMVLATAALGAAVTCIAASLLPALRAGRLPAVEALRHE